MPAKEVNHEGTNAQWDNIIKTTLPESYVANSNDLLWAVDTDRKLIFANAAYRDFVYKSSGAELHVNEYSQTPDGNKNMADMWDYFYSRALKGEHFHIIINLAVQQMPMIVDANFIPLMQDNHILGTACLARSTSSMVLPSIVGPTEEEENSFHSRS